MRVNTNAWNRVRYGLFSPFYDVVGRLLDRGRRMSIKLVDPKPGERILIVGAGTGLDLPYLPRNADTTAVDLTPSMLRKAETRARKLDLPVTFHVMDAHRLGFPNASFDVVLLHLILAVVPDPHACIREAARVLKPDGRIAIFDKFLPDGTRPSLIRRMLGYVTDALFSDINRQLRPLLAEAGLVAVRDEPAFMGRLFRIVVASPATFDQ